MADGVHQLAVGQLQAAIDLGAKVWQLAVDKPGPLFVGCGLIGADARGNERGVAEGTRLCDLHLAHAIHRRQARRRPSGTCHPRRIVPPEYQAHPGMSDSGYGVHCPYPYAVPGARRTCETGGKRSPAGGAAFRVWRTTCAGAGNTIRRVAHSETGPWPIPLRRSIPRLALVVVLRAAIGAAAIVTAMATFGVVATVLNLTGAACLIYALLLGLYLFSLRLEAIPNELRLRSLFGTRNYRLRRGEVRRLWVEFSRRPLEARVGTMGVRVGEGQLGGEKLVDVIALDQASTLLMVPVEGGRLAVADRKRGDADGGTSPGRALGLPTPPCPGKQRAGPCGPALPGWVGIVSSYFLNWK